MVNIEEGDSWRDKIGGLEHTEFEAFLGEGKIARLACLDKDGWPYVVPCWYEWDGESFWVVPRLKSAWAEYLDANPKCAITIDEEGAHRKVSAQCEATKVEDPNLNGQWVSIAERMSIRYLGPNGKQFLLEPTFEKKRWLFRLDPVRMWSWQGVDWAKRYKED